MATSVPPSELERQRCVDLDAVRRYWTHNARQLPNSKLFRDPELQAAVALGIEALVRNSRPGTIQIQLKACYDRLMGTSLVNWEQVLDVAEHVYGNAIGRPEISAFSSDWRARPDTLMLEGDVDALRSACRLGRRSGYAGSTK